MNISFTKMQGAGNDYIYIDTISKPWPADKDKSEVTVKLSDRHFGIGGDGVIFINASDEADFEMEMYNMDGSRSEMCGNGIRCVAKYVYDHGMTGQKTEFSIISSGKVKYMTVYPDPETGKADQIRVNMGSPILEAEKIPVEARKSPVVSEPIEVAGKSYVMTCVSMGNPHAVIFVDNTEDYPLEQVGPLFECHWRFPKRVNTEFVQVLDRTHVRMRVWERGTGETLACGTGCCATAVACILNGLTEDEITVKVLGGEIRVKWDRTENLVWMTGPAREVFSGTVEI